MAEPSILGALRDPQFRSDTLRNLVEALNGAKRSLTVGSLGAVGDMGNTLANLVRAGAGTAYHETTGRPIPQALEYRDPARDFGTSASLGNFAESQGWLPPQTFSMPEQAGALLGPIVAMKAPDLAQSTLRGLVSALKSEPSRRMVEGLVDGMGARPKIFAGEGAQTADMQALAKAQQLENAGTPERAIWSDTGWFRGADKKWRFEIDDSLARFNPSRADGGIVENAIQNGTSGMNFGPTVGPGMNGHLYHPALFDAYGKDLPQNTFIGNKNTLFGDGVQGAFDSATDSITLNAPVQPRDGRSTLLHELQHAVQQREGFAKGGSVEGMQSLMTKRLDVKSRFDRALEQFMTTSDPIAKGNAQQEMTHYGLELAKLPNADSAGDAYLKLAGEAEARAVQSRMNMTPEQRRATFPFDSYDVPRDKLILRDLLKGPAQSVYHRYTQGGPDNGAGYMMYADDPAKVENGYGRNHWTVDDAKLPPGSVIDADSPEFQKLARRALVRDHETTKQYWNGQRSFRDLVRDLVGDAAPRDIVNSAGLWDAPDLVDSVYRHGLDPSMLSAVRTPDGLISFDPSHAVRSK